jgi:penicillin-binding protein 2
MNENRRFFFFGLAVFIALIFLIRLSNLQVFDSTYRSEAENNIIQRNVEFPFRGLILDRNGKILAENTPSFTLQVIPKQLKSEQQSGICDWLKISEEDFEKKVKTAKSFSYYKPSNFVELLPQNEFASLEDFLVDFDGFIVKPILRRSYPHQSLSGALGYVAEINKDRLGKENHKAYSQGDMVGISGIELEYEDILFGKKGVKYEMVNVKGVVQGSFKDYQFDTAAFPGKNLTISVDLDLQQYAESLMKGKRGSVIAIEPSSGEILSFVSSPYYDPNLLTGRDLGSNFARMLEDTTKPLFNRPLMAAYPPGSIFKMVQAPVALQTGVITPATRITCNRNIIACHGSHTREDLQGAIQYSCNPYFRQVYRLVLNRNISENTYEDTRIGLNAWREKIVSFGFGYPLGIDLPNEKGGFIPDSPYYDKIYGKNRWKFSTIYSLAIGQGEILVVPIQMANLAAILANRGFYFRPHFIKKINDGETAIPEQYLQKRYTRVDSGYFQVVIDAMEKVVESGTGFRGAVPGLRVCGKTGTAENPHGEDHSVFIAFAPKDDPKIAISVYVENSGQGARAAAGIAGLLMQKYLLGKIQNPYLEDYILKGEFFY